MHFRGFINSFKLPRHTKDIKNCTNYYSVLRRTMRIKAGNALDLKRAQLIPCAVVLLNKGDKIQQAGCLTGESAN